MGRFNFGGGIADWTLALGDAVTVGGFDGRAAVAIGSVPVTFWNAETQGSQHADLVDADGSPVSQIISADGTGTRSLGQIPPFTGPDDVTTMWAEAGEGGPRALMVTTDAASATGDIGTILPPLSVSGAVAVGAGAHRLYNDTTAVLDVVAIRASLGTAGASATTIDANRNGSTMFPTQTERPTIAAGQNTTGKVSLTSPVQLAPGDWLTVDVDLAGNGARDLVVQFLIMKG